MTIRTDARLPAEIQAAVQALARRQMVAPALLFLLGHRALTFVCGQLLYGIAPMATLLGYSTCCTWAALLSDPVGVAQIEEALVNAAE